ncbi:MAG: UDP-N-acetylglucosamine 2-epimerase (non-hydrolyzing) [Bacteroidetes bacterium]|nr:UDP-N-acetylglucosamine 2-epimerase (non-hydrolyzing) [Bacteroidota bacterium]
MKIDLIAGARPNFMKIAPIIHAIKASDAYLNGTMSFRLVHTGQHYDKNMSEQFFTQLNIPEPDINLEAGGGTQAEQTSRIMLGYEQLLLKESCDLTLVVGDVTSTLACSIVAKKLNIKVAHVEAGIRSWDLSMPEEINRMVTDSITDYFFTTTTLADENLRNMGVSEDRIYRIGNVMIDTLLANQPKFKAPPIWNEMGLERGNYFVLTLHRPANVDDINTLERIIESIVTSCRDLPVIWPIHPRSRKVFEKHQTQFSNLFLIDPLGYLEFNYLVENAKAVITDSGGITEETTVMGIPCITLRDNTERPETVTIGTNELIGTNPKSIAPAIEKLFEGNWKRGAIPELWDGHAAERLVRILQDLKS